MYFTPLQLFFRKNVSVLKDFCYFCNTVSIYVREKMLGITEKTIDIEDILRSKLGAKSKYVPRPLVSWLKHIVHQDEVNKFLWESRGKTGVEWLEECVTYLDMTLNVEGMENLPPKDDGRLYTFVSNHPLGGQD